VKHGNELCKQHLWEHRRWAGQIDKDGNPTGGWGPDNPIPKGVTVALAETQRRSIRTQCTEERGCSDSYGPRP
jgi:hypothetical protein